MDTMYGERGLGFLMLFAKEDGAKQAITQIVLRRELNKRFDEVKAIFWQSPGKDE